ncbi:nucleoside-triphosphatase [Chloroflexota bacterium]
MVIVVTGEIGIGKTTVCRTVVSICRDCGLTYGGILSDKIEPGRIFIEDLTAGSRSLLAKKGRGLDGPCTAGYSFSLAGVEYGNRAIESATSAFLVVVDELGQLELRGCGFARVLAMVTEYPLQHWVLVIRSQLLPSFVPHLPADVRTFETTTSTRDTLPQRIVSLLFQQTR